MSIPTVPTFPTLFKLSNDKIYEWSIKVQHKNNDIYTICYITKWLQILINQSPIRTSC